MSSVERISSFKTQRSSNFLILNLCKENNWLHRFSSIMNHFKKIFIKIRPLKSLFICIFIKYVKFVPIIKIEIFCILNFKVNIKFGYFSSLCSNIFPLSRFKNTKVIFKSIVIFIFPYKLISISFNEIIFF